MLHVFSFTLLVFAGGKPDLRPSHNIGQLFGKRRILQVGPTPLSLSLMSSMSSIELEMLSKLKIFRGSLYL